MCIYKVIVEKNVNNNITKDEVYLKGHKYAIRYIINDIYEAQLQNLPKDSKTYFMDIKNTLKTDNKYTFNNINYIIEEINVYYEDYSDEYIRNLVHKSPY